MKVSFLIKRSKLNSKGKTPIYAKIVLDRNVRLVSTGMMTKLSDWNSGKSRIKEVNEALKAIERKIILSYSETINTGKISATRVVETYKGSSSEHTLFSTLDVHNRNFQKKVNKLYSIGTYKHFCSFKNTLSQFTKDLPLAHVDIKFLETFEEFLLDRGLSPNTISRYHSRLRKVINFGIRYYSLNIRNPYSVYKIHQEKTDRGFLSDQELTAIIEYPFEGRLERIRDLFVFQCYTGLSYIDLYNLTKDDIKDGCIQIKRKKTKTNSFIPLLKISSEILIKYDHKLPTLSNQKYNKYLKEVANFCQLRKRLSSHIARHTFATTVTMSNGVSIEVISKMLGHSSLRTTQIYARVMEDKIRKEMSDLEKKIKGS